MLVSLKNPVHLIKYIFFEACLKNYRCMWRNCGCCLLGNNVGSCAKILKMQWNKIFHYEIFILVADSQVLGASIRRWCSIACHAL